MSITSNRESYHFRGITIAEFPPLLSQRLPLSKSLWDQPHKHYGHKGRSDAEYPASVSPSANLSNMAPVHKWWLSSLSSSCFLHLTHQPQNCSENKSSLILMDYQWKRTRRKSSGGGIAWESVGSLYFTADLSGRSVNRRQMKTEEYKTLDL